MTGLGQDTDYAMTLNGIKVLTSFLFRETAFGSIDPSDRFGRTRLSTFAAKTCGRGTQVVKELVRERENIEDRILSWWEPAQKLNSREMSADTGERSVLYLKHFS